MSRKLDTPCIGVCSTIYGDKICRGCKRTYQEVIDWNGYSRAQKDAVFTRLEEVIVGAMDGKIIITDHELLCQQLAKLRIRHNTEEHPLCLAYYLLRQGHDRITELGKYGIKIAPKYQDKSLSELYYLLDSELQNI